jgi:hypothetical protein
MTPKQLAKAECANWDRGACLGQGIEWDVCRVAQGERCRYFEASVLPLEDSTRDAKYRQAIREARRTYQQDKRPAILLCECGGEREKGCKYCPECRQNARRKQWRQQKQRTAA